MEYISTREAAEQWGVTPRWVQQCCKNGLIPGAARLGNAWGVPKAAKRPAPVHDGTKKAFMPLMGGAFAPGRCREYIDSLTDEDERTIARAEQDYFSGRPEQAAARTEPCLIHRDTAIRLSAAILYGYANLSLGRIHAARYGMDLIRRDPAAQGCAEGAFARTMATVLLHLPDDGPPHVAGAIHLLPDGLRLYACYLLAHGVYLQGDYGRSLGIAETALALQDTLYPIPAVYVHLVAAMDLMSLKRMEDAKKHFYSAWKIARPDGLIESFGEHHGLLQGLVETCLKDAFPAEYERVIGVTYRFSAGWRRVHNPDANEEVADNLSTLEFTVAMLANRGWANQEIASHLKMSVHTVKHHMSAVYQKLGISSRSGLKKYMLR